MNRLRQKVSQTLALATVVLLPVIALALLGIAAVAQAQSMPYVDLNGAAPGANYATTFTEDAGPELIVDPAGLTIAGGSGETLAWVRAALVSRPDVNDEVLSANSGVTGLNVKYNADTGILTVKGTASLSAYEQVLRTLSYDNGSQNPDLADRVVLVTAHDGLVQGDPVTSTVAINSVNDAPVLDNSGAMTLKSINEDETDSPGNSVEAILASAGGDRLTDVDGIAEGIAVVEVGSSNGAWEFSLNGGVNWTPFVGVSNSAAVLLNPAARIRFVPNLGYTGSAAIIFRAWDQTTGSSGQAGVDASQNGGSTAFSAATETASIEVLAIDQLAVVDLNGSMAGIDFAATYLKGAAPVAIAAPDATVSDVDDSVLQSVTIVLTNRPDGAAEWLAADPLTTTLTIVPYNPATGVLKLQGPISQDMFSKVLRTVTYQNTDSSLSLQPRVVQVSGTDHTTAGGIATTTLTIVSENSAPILAPLGPLSFVPVPEDSAAPAGQAVAAMLASAGGDPISDSDEGALRGIAVTGLDTAHGIWQFSADLAAGAVWQAFGPVSEAAAVLLTPEAGIRFIPAADYSGPAGAFTFRAWDQTTGTNGLTGVDTMNNGGSTAFSTATAIASLSVTPVNDPPQIANQPLTLTYVEDAPPVALFDASLAVADVDSSMLSAAAVQLLAPPDGASEVLSVSPGDSGLQVAFNAGILTLQGQAPPAVYATVLRTVRYRHLSQDPTPGARALQVVVSDETDASAPSALSLQVQAVNDPPVVDLNGVAPGVDFSTDFYAKWGPVPIGDGNLTLIDVDQTMLASVSVTITNPIDAPGEFLDADVSVAANITKTFDPSTGIMTLQGADSLANYQAVVRTVTYNNILPQPDLRERTLIVVANDGLDVGTPAASAVDVNPIRTATIFMPLAAQRSEEPNDTCSEAFWLATDRTVSLLPDDVTDWFYFDTSEPASITVELRSFMPAAGQVIVYSGKDCKNAKFLANNGDDQPNKDVKLGQRSPGRYYVRVINDGPILAAPYTLRVRLTP